MMKLTDIDLRGFGAFSEEFGAFTTNRFFLERDWDTILGDERLYWRVHHNGKGYLQENPPGGTYWLRANGAHDIPAWLMFLSIDDNPLCYFANFWGPRHGAVDRQIEPDRFECQWHPDRGVFVVEHEDIFVKTQLGTTASATAAFMTVRIENRDRVPRRAALIPRLVPWLTDAQPAAWAMPWLYQSATYEPDANAVYFEMRDPGGDARKRRRLVWHVTPRFDRLCLRETIFNGKGSSAAPDALNDWRDWPDADEAHTIYGEPLFAAMATETTLAPDESCEVTMVLADATDAPGRQLESRRPAHVQPILLDPEAELEQVFKRAHGEALRFSVLTPDPAFTRYVNEYLPLQLRTVLKRGWPCRMIGVRDTAQDYTAAAAWYPEEARAVLLKLLETERADGWFLRQVSTEGRHGQHDARPYVDSGLWVWELAYEYICQTRDFNVLDDELPFLDSDERVPVAEHLARLLSYFMAPENLGEHGLCKIRGGDWNDSVNLAGREGRGESVMVSCHLLLCLRQAIKLFESRSGTARRAGAAPDDYRAFADTMRAAVRGAALNAQGYLNGVFSDAGQWFFSDADPDGQARFNVPVNAFGMIAGVFEPNELKPLYKKILGIRRDYGYPLFTPAIGEPPMAGLGRIGSGDLRPGLGENGTCYNHGCHGFLARALAALGQGDLFLDVMLCLFPYDQERHPVSMAHTAPYAIVNVYGDAPGHEGEGGDTFFSGSIAVAVRNIYQGMLGLHAEPDGLRVTPCLPTDWPKVEGRFFYAGRQRSIVVKRKGKALDIRIDDTPVQDGFLPADAGG